jgi:hypothetical protein
MSAEGVRPNVVEKVPVHNVQASTWSAPIPQTSELQLEHPRKSLYFS